MSVLAFKALGYGAEQIPDKFFEKIPGGFFRSGEEKKNGKKSRSPPKEKSRRNSERSRRERSPLNDHSDYSGHDTDYEEEQRRKERRRRKSTGRSTSRSLSRGRDQQRSRDVEGEYSGKDMAHAEQGQGQEPYFPPPPTSEYAPYNTQEHASRPGQGDYRPTSAQPQYSYPTQVNSPFCFRSATVPMMASHPTPVNSCPPLLLNRPPSNAPSPFAGLQPHLFDHLHRGTPISASFSPSYEPPLAAVLRLPPTNSPQPAYGQSFPTQPPVNRSDGTSPPAVAYGDETAHRCEEIQHAKAGQAPRSASAARYTPGPGYAPSPAVMPAAPIPPSPVGVNSPPVGANAPYAPYNPAIYAAHNPAYPPGNGYASPPPFYRQQSRSQPSFDQNQYHSSYNPRSSDQQVAPYDDRHSPSRRSSTKHNRREHRQRARFDDMDLRTKNLGATVAGAAAGALGGQAIATRNVDRAKDEHGRLPSRSRSRSRHRKHEDRAHSRDRKSGGGLRARSRSIIDRFRSKSRGRDDRDDRSDRSRRDDRDDRDRHYDSGSHYDSDDRRRRRDRSRDSRRPDRGYKVHEEYDYFTESDSDGDESPVVQRRKKTVKRRDY
ncbi:hypothetical protein BU25DRAFT_274134 [Macroventuria anomochaeta]|uniref:Uncharacterized protein n=1 Tax=Macroventuria anomochaeta TaxID=301207 RepID=A0ACB6S679_9PLEO|nr:uncharacterized protein BU25DRAFT_274134 [Macroventuria anomochaeta]KAF2629781.1 hypothetical protein BU25DRAFT_274134 [Macroventuria anomochaeta]